MIQLDNSKFDKSEFYEIFFESLSFEKNIFQDEKIIPIFLEWHTYSNLVLNEPEKNYPLSINVNEFNNTFHQLNYPQESLVTGDSTDIPLDLQTFGDYQGKFTNDSCEEETNSWDRLEINFNKVFEENNFVDLKNQIDDETINYSKLLLISNKKETGKILYSSVIPVRPI